MVSIWTVKFVLNLVFYRPPLFPIIDKTKCNKNLKFGVVDPLQLKTTPNLIRMYKLDHPGSMSSDASAVSSWGSLSQLIGGFFFLV